MTDLILECIAENCSKLMYLDLGGCRNITDAGVEKLSSLENLTGLVLSKSKVP